MRHEGEGMQIIDESGDKAFFTIVPNYVLNHSTMYDREVYIQMKRIAGEKGTCWMARNSLAKQCGISLDRLKKSIKYLVDHGWIERIGDKSVDTSGGAQKVNEYRIVDLWDVNNDFYQKSKGGSSKNPPSSQRGVVDDIKGGSSGNPKEELIQEYNTNTILSHEKKLQPHRTDALYSDSSFQEFWNLYPRKTGKGAAWKSWVKLRLSEDEKKSAIAMVSALKQTSQWAEIRFVPHAQTFLNQRRFDDELPETESFVPLRRI